MKRRLLYQMRNEWRSNIWMIIQLLIVSVILWGIFWLFIELIAVKNRHFGYDLTDVYVADIKFVPKTSSTFQPYDSAHSYYTDRALLRGRINSLPCVELTGMGFNCMPYNYNYSGMPVEYTEADSTYRYNGNNRAMTPDVVRIMRLEGLNGETPEELASILERGEILLSDFDYSFYNPAPGPECFVGKDVMINRDSTYIRRVGATVHGIHRTDYESIFGGVVITPVGDNDWAAQFIIRVKPGMGKEFMETINAEMLEQGNVYLSNLQSINRMRDVAHVDITNIVRNMSACAGFLLIVIFLGFLGTFWFRTQQRVAEIAVRMVNGATRRDIFRRLLTEGMILLITATVPAIIIEYAIIRGEVLSWGLTGGYTFAYISIPVTFCILTVMIIAGIWMPARKAMNINPATALKEE